MTSTPTTSPALTTVWVVGSVPNVTMLPDCEIHPLPAKRDVTDHLRYSANSQIHLSGVLVFGSCEPGEDEWSGPDEMLTYVMRQVQLIRDVQGEISNVSCSRCFRTGK